MFTCIAISTTKKGFFGSPVGTPIEAHFFFRKNHLAVIVTALFLQHKNILFILRNSFVGWNKHKNYLFLFHEDRKKSKMLLYSGNLHAIFLKLKKITHSTVIRLPSIVIASNWGAGEVDREMRCSSRWCLWMNDASANSCYFYTIERRGRRRRRSLHLGNRVSLSLSVLT